MAFEDNLYCDFDAGAAKALAGKDILLAVFDETGADLLAVAGQQGLSINRNADNIDVSSKDTKGGWKSSMAGMKEWSIDNDGLYVPTDAAHKALGKAFADSDPVCIKIVNQKLEEAMFGGLAYVVDYSLDAPFDDAVTYDITLEGNGPLVDLTDEVAADQMPD